jgi:hypothetical protein
MHCVEGRMCIASIGDSTELVGVLQGRVGCVTEYEHEHTADVGNEVFKRAEGKPWEHEALRTANRREAPWTGAQQML